MASGMIPTVLSLILSAATTTTAPVAVEPPEVPVWPGLDPGLKAAEQVEDRTTAAGRRDRFVAEVRYPTLTVYLPDAEGAGVATPTPAVVICPGGGYRGVAIDKEGHEVARWLNSIGVAGVILKYRVPDYGATKDGEPLPLLDAREAVRLVRLVRARAGEWNVDPARVGVMGFSAGGHLASTLITHPGDDPGTRPAFAVLVYPVVSMDDRVTHGGSKERLLSKAPDPKMVELYSNELRVSGRTPPTFLIHAKDDRVKFQNSVLFHEALQRHGVSAEVHLFEKGGHGFGLGTNGGEVATWPGLCEKWLRARKILPAG